MAVSEKQENIVGMNIRRIRKEKKLTQDKLADLLFIDRAAISRYENGSNGVMGIDVLMRFCGALGVTPNDLLLPAQEEIIPVEKFKQLNEINQKTAATVIDSLLFQQQMTA